MEAREDLRAVTDQICTSGPHLEWAAGIAGHVDERGRVVVEAIRMNESRPTRNPRCGSTARRLQVRGDGARQSRRRFSFARLVARDPVEPSQADFECWTRAAAGLDQPYVGLILGAVDAGEALPRATFDSPRAPALGCWVARPNGTVRRASLNLEPDGWPRRRAKSDSVERNPAMPRSTTPATSKEEMLVCVATYVTSSEHGSPVVVRVGDTYRGGPGSFPARHPQYWAPVGSDSAEIGRARGALLARRGG